MRAVMMTAAALQIAQSPPRLRTSLDVIAVLSMLTTLLFLWLQVLWSPRPSNETSPVHGRLATIRFWRPVHFSQGLRRLEELCELYTRGEYSDRDIRGLVTRRDLVTWITQLALTCAANMVPESLGRANLFRVSQIECDSDGIIIYVRVDSSGFDGIFSANQLTDFVDHKRLRDISVRRQGPGPLLYPAALQCVMSGSPIIQSIRRRNSEFDAPERALGVTHVLAIPLTSDLGSLSLDDPVSITVDMRYALIAGLLMDRTRWYTRTLIRRALALSRVLSASGALSHSPYMP
jgi:hypothetical protein